MLDKAKNSEKVYKEGKWIWKMDYCRKQEIPPAQSWAWDMAEEAYVKNSKKNTSITVLLKNH